MTEKKCLIITSNGTKQDDFFYDVARQVLDKFNIYNLKKSDLIQMPGERVQSIVYPGELIEQSDFLLVNISQNDADLMYSIGYAHALNKLAMFYVYDNVSYSVPEFLSGYIYRVYESGYDLKKFIYRDIERYISRVTDEKSKV